MLRGYVTNLFGRCCGLFCSIPCIFSFQGLIIPLVISAIGTTQQLVCAVQRQAHTSMAKVPVARMISPPPAVFAKVVSLVSRT